MNKRVHFAESIANEGGDVPMNRTEASLETSSGWYSTQELRAFRREISASLDADKVENTQQTLSKLCPNERCMRGLEIYASKVRRDLQKHYARSIIEAQRRIKARTKRKRSEAEDSVLLQQVAEKYSQYARDRAYQIAKRDEVDSHRVHEEAPLPQCTRDSGIPSTKKPCPSQTQARIVQQGTHLPPSKRQCLGRG